MTGDNLINNLRLRYERNQEALFKLEAEQYNNQLGFDDGYAIGYLKGRNRLLFMLIMELEEGDSIE